MVPYNLADEEETDVIGEQVKAAAAVRARGPSVCTEKCRCVLCWPMTLQLL